MPFRRTRRVRVITNALAAGVLVASAVTGAAAQGKSSDWVASWATAVTAAEPSGASQNGFSNQSYRMSVHLSVGGDQFRVRLTNAYGTRAVTIGHATVATPNTSTPQNFDVLPATLRPLTFDGATSATMLPGAELISDPVDWRVNDMANLVVSLYFPTATGPYTWHATSLTSSFKGAGDLTTEAAGAWTQQSQCCWTFLSGVDVLRHQANGVVAVLGDSISDGNGSTLNANTRWPDLLAKRLLTEKGNSKHPSVVNVSLSGNRLNHEGPEPGTGGFPGFVQLGRNAAARLNGDVFPLPGVTTVILQLGVDDIWLNGDSAEAITTTLQQIAEQLQHRGLDVIVSTITPFHGIEQTFPGAWTIERETTRNEINTFIRSNQTFDGVVDFDMALRDPVDSSRLRPTFDSGDHFNPNDAGAQQMANFFPLGLLP